MKSVAEVLGKGAFARPEEARYPDADTLMRFGGGIGDGTEQLMVLFADAVRGDVFSDLVVDRLLVCLIDL